MLITTCGFCGARFRVTPQQLNAKQGQVRCGSCERVFNGFEALERHPDDDTGTRLLAAREAAERALQQEPPMPALEEVGSVETLQSEPQESLPPREAQQETPSAPPPPRPRIARPDLVLPPPPRAAPPARAWRFGVALMVTLIGVEMAYAYRGPLAQRYPVLRPWLEAVCVKANCNVPWSREEQLLKLEDSELLEVPGKPQEIALGARIRNLAHAAQEYPHLELTLTDITGQAAVRRVLRPTDYLGRPLSQGEVMAPGAELSLQLRLETPRMKATGYELLLFYP